MAAKTADEGISSGVDRQMPRPWRSLAGYGGRRPGTFMPGTAGNGKAGGRPAGLPRRDLRSAGPIGSIGPTRGRCLAQLRVLPDASSRYQPCSPAAHLNRGWGSGNPTIRW